MQHKSAELNILIKETMPCTDCPFYGVCLSLEMACLTFFVYINQEEVGLRKAAKHFGISTRWQDYLNSRKPSVELYNASFPEDDKYKWRSILKPNPGAVAL